MKDARCSPAEGPVRERNPFPVFPGEVEVEGPIKRSRMGRRRALVLGAVHVAIAAHVVHWRVAGRTLSPVEPSESMRTLELGEVNAGVLFFAAAILATLVFGRFFCGWGCHVVALQDLCGWILRRLGIRPRPFRSRLLAWVPLGLALYMFVWPTAKRVAIAPLAQRILGERSFVERPPDFPGFSDHLLTGDFWATFPAVAVAVPFLLICGFAVVLLLGAKGFCTYGCPYGAFFGTADLVAPGRIRVNDRCDGCGHCSAVCTSNVLVHAEVRRHRMVVDPGCMKCMDCVSTCPNDALRFGFGPLPRRSAPAREAAAPRGDAADAGAPATRPYDLGRGAEVAVAAGFLATLLAWRGAYGLVPLLMAVGIALCGAWLGWTAVRLARERDVELHGLALKRDGRPRAPGAAVAAFAALGVLLTVQAGAVGVLRGRADAADRAVTVPREAVFAGRAGEIGAETRRAAERAARLYGLADGATAGGIGLVATGEVALRRAWLALVLGRPADALGHLERAVGERPAALAARLDVARVRALAGRAEEARAELLAIVAERPADVDAHRALADVLESSGDAAAAAARLAIVVNLDPDDRASRVRLAGLLEGLGRAEEARRYR